jgi:branched-chain amino acid aminotransferase
MGGMNLMFVHGSLDDSGGAVRLVTPALTGSLLPGVTRDCLLTLAGDHGFVAEARRVSVEEWHQGNLDGTISEVFACGTAAVITPVGVVKSATQSWPIGDGGTGPVTARLRQTLLDIQTGAAPDVHGWNHVLVGPR